MPYMHNAPLSNFIFICVCSDSTNIHQHVHAHWYVRMYYMFKLDLECAMFCKDVINVKFCKDVITLYVRVTLLLWLLSLTTLNIAATPTLMHDTMYDLLFAAHLNQSRPYLLQRPPLHIRLSRSC